MSPNVGNFVHDLVEMAKATERLPVLEELVEALTKERDDYRNTVASREARIMDLKNDLDAANAKIREVEVERDDASFRLLQVEDSFNKVFSQAGAMLSAANGVQELLHPAPVSVQVDPTPTVTGAPSPSEVGSTGSQELPVIEHEPFPDQSDSGEHSSPATAEMTPQPNDVSASSQDSVTPTPAGHPEPTPSYANQRWSDLTFTEREAFWKHLDSTSGLYGDDYWVACGGYRDDYHR